MPPSIHTKTPRRLAIMALCLVSFCGCDRNADDSATPAPQGTTTQRPNVLVMTLDTTRVDYVGCYGSKTATTPALDALAAAGTRFADAVSVAPVTLPAHCSMFTGLYPPNHGVRHNRGFRLAEDQTTLAEILRGTGYETAAFVGAFVLAGRFGLAQGFDLYDDHMENPTAAFGKDLQRPASQVTDSTIRWLDDRDDNRPFFAWVHYYDPHESYLPHEEVGTTKLSSAKEKYQGEIDYMDLHIGRLLAVLDRKGLRDNTIIFAVADHGESLGEHDEATHTRTIYRAAMQVPFIVALPGGAAGEVVDGAVVSVVDVFPTILQLLKIPHDGVCDGQSVMDVPPQTDRRVFMETMVTYLDNGWAPLYALRLHDAKFILAPKPEYYEIRKDPDEATNLFGKLEGAAADKPWALEAILGKLVADWPSPSEVAAGTIREDPQTKRMLASLGYVSDETPIEEGDLPNPADMLPNWEKVRLATKLGRDNMHQEALRVLEEVVKASPRDRSAHHKMGMYYLRLNNPEKAAQSLRKAVSIRPTPPSCLLLAQILLGRSEWEEAETLLNLAMKLDPAHGAVHIAMGDLRASRGRFKEARAAFEKAKEVDPDRASGLADARLKQLAQFEKTQKPAD